MLAEALELEIAEHLEQYAQIRDEQGHQQVVRNGHCKERKIVTGVGEVEITQRVRGSFVGRLQGGFPAVVPWSA